MEQAIGLMGEDLTAEAASDYGRALSQQGRNEEALEALSLAIQAEGDNPKYRLNRAILREQLGDAMGAVIDLMPVIEAQPDREEVR